jgi:hypothetical protein
VGGGGVGVGPPPPHPKPQSPIPNPQSPINSFIMIYVVKLNIISEIKIYIFIYKINILIF